MFPYTYTAKYFHRTKDPTLCVRSKYSNYRYELRAPRNRQRTAESHSQLDVLQRGSTQLHNAWFITQHYAQIFRAVAMLFSTFLKNNTTA
jgi:hypothetical protein